VRENKEEGPKAPPSPTPPTGQGISSMLEQKARQDLRVQAAMQTFKAKIVGIDPK
jgi:hypothetical protein